MLTFDGHKVLTRISLSVLIILIINVDCLAQCCSPGNPVGGTANLSIVPKHTLRVNTYFRHGYSDTYYEGSAKSDFQFVDNASYNYMGTILTYGLFKKLNVEAELGYYFNKTQHYDLNTAVYSLEGFGLKEGVLSLKYNIYKHVGKEVEFTGALGTKIPFSRKPLERNNVELPIDVQPSGMAFGIVAQTFLYKGFIANGLHLFLLNRYEKSFESPQQYQYGQVFYTSVFVSKSLNTQWSLILQIRDEWRDADKRLGQLVPSSGGNVLFIAPQLNYNILQKWNISILADIPVYRQYNGTQLSPKYAFSILVSKEFDLSKKPKTQNSILH